MRALAADDDPPTLSSLVRCLKSWGYDVVTASDGIEAWNVVKNEKTPRVVVMDWEMPGLSGIEVCRLLRNAPHGEDVYVLMLTARDEKADVIEALEAGADDFLPKPFHPRELQLRLAKAAAAQASRRVRSPTLSGSPPSGSTLGGKYRLEKQIAEGGMASVWLGVHLSLGIDVAIKFMKPGILGKPDYASFEREARAAAQLRSEHIMRVYDHGIAHDGSPYLVMEYLDGESMGEDVDRRGALPPSAVVNVIDHIARALTEAHAHGIIHGDVKPENILVVNDPHRPHGCAKLVDFGLARSRVNAPSDDDNAICGTPSYMSPEHLRGAARPNPALDLWGLAAAAYTALTGVVAFDGESVPEILLKLCVKPLPVPSAINPNLSPAVDAWFAKACARAPKDRFQTPTELAQALTEACADLSFDFVSAPVQHGENAGTTNSPDTEVELEPPRSGP
jgi:serine/threonine protein kinase/CheY-like chemotaxis protein